MQESLQHKLDRVRPPRVQITYDVEIGGAIQMKELPLIVGVLADLSGQPEIALPKVKERKFVFIDRDNFNEVLASYTPRIAVRVDNKLVDDNTKLNVELKFNHLDDFNPISVVKQVSPLNKLYEARKKLRDLLTKLDGNDELDNLLQQTVKDTEQLNQLKTDLGGN